MVNGSLAPNRAVQPIVVAAPKQTFGHRARSTDMGEFLTFEENAVDLGNAPHHDIQPPA